jgi:hypothetical protein
MLPRQREYPLEEFARRGQELYEQQIRSRVEAGNHGKIVAIAIDSGAYEVADDLGAAGKQIFARYPDAQVWYMRIGYPAVDRFSYVPPENSA